MEDRQLLNNHIKEKFELSARAVLTFTFKLFGRAAFKYMLMMAIFGAASLLAMAFGFFSVVIMMVVLMLLLFVAVPVMQVGYGWFTKKIIEGKNPELSDFLSGFKYNLPQLIIQAVIVTVVVLAVVILPNLAYWQDYLNTMIEIGQQPEEMDLLLTELNERHSDFNWHQSLAGMFSFYIGLVLSMVPYLVSFFKINAITAIDISIRSMNKVIFQVVAIRIIFMFIAMGTLILGTLLGPLGTFFSILFFVPVFLIGTYLVFHLLFGQLLEDSVASESNFEID